MRPGRLVVLVGTLVASGALYLQHLAVDGPAFRALSGGSVPTIWQELGRWGRPAAVLLAAALVALSFRPGSGPIDQFGAVGAVLVAAGAVAGGVLGWQAAGDDAAVVAAALGQAGAGNGGASAGPGFWLLLSGTSGAAIGAIWDFLSSRRSGGRAHPVGPSSVGEEDAAAA
jgi:hypothetical protein